jgi:alpha-glucuronidase
MLDHWDNLDGEHRARLRGRSLWRWDELPGTISRAFATTRAPSASVGINAAVLNNVNASALILTPVYLHKVAALATCSVPGASAFSSRRISARPSISAACRPPIRLDDAVGRLVARQGRRDSSR